MAFHVIQIKMPRHCKKICLVFKENIFVGSLPSIWKNNKYAYHTGVMIQSTQVQDPIHLFLPDKD